MTKKALGHVYRISTRLRQSSTYLTLEKDKTIVIKGNHMIRFSNPA